MAKATSKLSQEKQREARGVVFVGLILVALYAFGGPGEQLQIRVPVAGLNVNVAGLVAAAAFAIAFLLRLYSTVNHPERKWYVSRGLTAEIESYVWRYAMCGRPYVKTQTSEAEALVEDNFSKTLHQFLARARREGLAFGIPANVGDDLPYITAWMAQARGKSIDARRIFYAGSRIRNQQDFYLRRARSYGRKTKSWNYSLMGIEVIFAGLAVVSALRLIPIQFFGVAGTLVAAGAAWLQFTQYRALTDLYTDMAFELGEFHRRCTQASRTLSEPEWADFVGSVENFLEAEHAAWRKLVDPEGPV